MVKAAAEMAEGVTLVEVVALEVLLQGGQVESRVAEGRAVAAEVEDSMVVVVKVREDRVAVAKAVVVA